MGAFTAASVRILIFQWLIVIIQFRQPTSFTFQWNYLGCSRVHRFGNEDIIGSDNVKLKESLNGHEGGKCVLIVGKIHDFDDKWKIFCGGLLGKILRPWTGHDHFATRWPFVKANKNELLPVSIPGKGNHCERTKKHDFFDHVLQPHVCLVGGNHLWPNGNVGPIL